MYCQSPGPSEKNIWTAASAQTLLNYNNKNTNYKSKFIFQKQKKNIKTHLKI